MPPKKKKKVEFKEFRSKEKSAYKTVKIPLKSILWNHEVTQPGLNDLVFKMNDVVIHTYQFIRLYILHEYDIIRNYDVSLTELNTSFILYCMKTVGIFTDQRKPSANIQLVEDLKMFYENEYQTIFLHVRINLDGCSHIVDELATQIEIAFHNNCQPNFIQHLVRFINKTTTAITTD